MPPRRNLPPLNAIRAFEAFARHGKMTTAADELCVTHGAVSRQIRQLEEWLGYPLTEGPKTQLRLTAQARRLGGAASAAFDLIHEAAGVPEAAEQELRLACHGTLAIRWLIPRLPDLVTRRPELHLQLHEITGEPDVDALPGIDAAIQLLNGPPTEGEAAFIDNWCGPVLSTQRWAALANDRARVRAEPRLHARTWPRAWNEWAATSRTVLPSGTPERSFDHFSHALEAAAAGLGVVMSPWTFVADDVAAGRLVAPFGFVRLPGRVALVRPKGRLHPGFAELADWLAEQVARMPAPPQSA